MPAFPATSKQDTIAADGRHPALALVVRRGVAVSPLAITDLTVTTTHNVATYHFTPPSIVNTSYLFQVAIGTQWGGDRYISAAAGASGEYNYTPLTPGNVYRGRIFVNGTVSNTFQFTMQAAPGITDLTVTTTETTAVHDFTRIAGTVSYCFQRSLDGGATWGGDILVGANALPAGPYTRTGVTAATAYQWRVLSDGTPSNVVDEPTKAAAVEPPPDEFSSVVMRKDFSNFDQDAAVHKEDVSPTPSNPYTGFDYFAGWSPTLLQGTRADTAITHMGRKSSAKMLIKQYWDGQISNSSSVGDGAYTFGGGINFQTRPGLNQDVWIGVSFYLPAGFDWRASLDADPAYTAGIKGRGQDKTHPRAGWWRVKFLRPTDNVNGWKIEAQVLSDNSGKHKGFALQREGYDRDNCDTTFPIHDDGCFVEGQWNYICYYMKLSGPGNPNEGIQRVWVNDTLALEWTGSTQKWLHPDGTYHTMSGAWAYPLLASNTGLLDGMMFCTYWNGGGNHVAGDGTVLKQDSTVPATHPKKTQSLWLDAILQATATPVSTDIFGNRFLSIEDIKYAGYVEPTP